MKVIRDNFNPLTVACIGKFTESSSNLEEYWDDKDNYKKIANYLVKLFINNLKKLNLLENLIIKKFYIKINC